MSGVEFELLMSEVHVKELSKVNVGDLHRSAISRIDVGNLYRRFTSRLRSKMSVVHGGRKPTWRAELCRRSNYKRNLVLNIEGRTAKISKIELRKLESELRRSRVIMKSQYDVAIIYQAYWVIYTKHKMSTGHFGKTR
jgi:hypothetical protein